MQPPSDTDPVRCMKPEPAILGGDITLTCILSQHMEAFQVTWCEIKGNKSKDLASFSKIYGPLVKQEFSAFISIVPLDPDEYFNRSTIEISKWEKEDEACYGCYFNINHVGAVPGDVFLADIGRLNLELFMSLDQGWTLPGFQKTLGWPDHCEPLSSFSDVSTACLVNTSCLVSTLFHFDHYHQPTPPLRSLSLSNACSVNVFHSLSQHSFPSLPFSAVSWVHPFSPILV